jgi:hypothetical protein
MGRNFPECGCMRAGADAVTKASQQAAAEECKAWSRRRIQGNFYVVREAENGCALL